MLGLIQDRQLLLSSILEHGARNFGSTPIIARTPHGLFSYSYSAASDRSRRLASSLHRLGIKPGDVISSLAWTTHRHFELLYAVPGLGAILHTANPKNSQQQLAHTLTTASCRLLFVDPDCLNIAEEAAGALASAETIVVLTDRADMPESTRWNLVCYEDLIADGDPSFEWPYFDERTASGLCFTSGTTGKPKGVVYSHRASLLAALSISHNQGWGIIATDTILAIPPFYHANGWGIPFFAPMFGAKLVLPGRGMDSANLHDLIIREDVTVTGGVPTMFLDLVAHCRHTNQGLGKLNRIFFGGSSQPHDFAHDLKKDYGITALNAWGMTETTIACTMTTLSPQPPAAGELRQTQGRPIYGAELRSVDEAGSALPRDGKACGHLQARGPWIASSYFKSDAPLCSDGWMQTGDMATVTPDNQLRIMDRERDAIKSGGEWISSLEIETAAMSHHGVKDAAAIAMRHPKWIERPLLVVVTVPGQDVTEQELRQHLAARVPKWWVPDVVIFVDAIPYNASGKIQKEALRTTYANYLENGATDARAEPGTR